MKFIKRGQIYSPAQLNNGTTRLMCPTPVLLNDDIIRVFIGFCDEKGISRPGYIDLNASNPSEVLNICQSPLLDIGKSGNFDDNGLCPTCVIQDINEIYFYYFGFQQLVKIPFYMFTGLASSINLSSKWKRESLVPVLDRTNEEPLMRSGAFVLKEDFTYKIYYPCGYDFIDVNGKQVHTYQIHYAESDNPKHWPANGRPIILFQNEDEYGFGRPFIFKQRESYIILYSIRTKSLGYRLGYAISKDSINWERKDNFVGLEIGKAGEWDSEMMCYSSFIKTNGKSYLFYNGNNLGSTGFGYAELMEE